MMEPQESESLVYAMYRLAAALSGLEATDSSIGEFMQVVRPAFSPGKVDEDRRPEAVSNLLRLLQEVLLSAQRTGDGVLHEGNTAEAKGKVCPVYPFD